MQVNEVLNTVQMVQQKKVGKTAPTKSTSFESYLNPKKVDTLEDIFQEAAETYKVDINLLKAIAKQESNFNKDAVSKSGARGIMQLMPATARELGVTDSFDARQNIMGGSKYISQMLKQFDGDTKLALAAYNAGGGNVRKYGGIPPFKETQNYVVKVMGYYKENLNLSDVAVTDSSKKAEQSLEGVKVSHYNPVEEVTVIPNITTTQQLQEQLEELYSYDDYLKFIEMLYGTSQTFESGNENPSNIFSTKAGIAPLLL